MKKETFAERRRTIKALQDFKPELAEDEKPITWEMLLIGFLSFCGTLFLIEWGGALILYLMR